MTKTPFIAADKLEQITAEFPTPFHLYDEKGIRETARAVNAAFSWNPGFKEFFKTWIPRKSCINCTCCFTNTFFIVKMERCGKFCSDLFKFISCNKRCFCHFILHFFYNSNPIIA